MSGRLFLAATALLCCAGAQRDTASGDKPVEIRTFVGETVILPCQIKHTADKEVPSVEWSKDGPKPIMAFLYRDGCESFLDKNPVFDYRTSLFMKELIHGNLSLKISNVQRSDAGIYRCRILRVPRDASTLELFVGAVSEPKLSVVPGPAVTLQCEASCWFPLPEITFLDHQGNDVSAEDQKSDRDSMSGCFNVTRRATVQTGNRVTCRVHQSEINQTRVTEIYIPDECMRSYIPIISVAVVVPFLIQSTIIAFLSWKCCNSEGERKLLSTQSSHRSSTCSNAESQNLTSQADPVQNANEVDELKSNLRDKDETIRRLTEELNDLRSKQSPVECHHGQPTIYRNPSKSSQGVSEPINFPSEELPQDIDPKPAASADSNRPKSGNMSPAAYPAVPAEGTHADRLRSVSDSPPRSNSAKAQRRYSISARTSNRFSVLENLPGDGSEPLLERRTE